MNISSLSPTNFSTAELQTSPMLTSSVPARTVISKIMTATENDSDLTLEYVNLVDTIANVALNQRMSSSLSTSLSILLSVMIITATFGNVMLLATILLSRKLRDKLIYLLFCEFCVMNMMEILFVMIFSVVGISKGFWDLGDTLCRLNTFAQEFLSLKIFFSLTLMAIERAIGFLRPHLITLRLLNALELAFIFVPALFAIPTLFSQFPIEFYPYRYLCSVGLGSPVAYTIVKVVVYCGCLFVLLVCFGSLLRHKTTDRSLPVNQQDYRAFIMESRALEEHLNLGRLVLTLAVTFAILEGPYVIMTFVVDVRNSMELLRQYGEDYDFPQYFETLIVWLKFFHPLICPIIIFAWCSDIWCNFSRMFFCRCKHRHIGNQIGSGRESHENNTNNVLTLVATAEGLQLRIPQHNAPVYGQPAFALPMTLAPVQEATGQKQQQQNRRQSFEMKQKEIEIHTDSTSDDSMATTSGGYIIQKPLVFRKRTQEERNSDDGVRPKPPAAKRTTTNVSFTNKNRNSKRKANNNNPNPRWKY